MDVGVGVEAVVAGGDWAASKFIPTKSRESSAAELRLAGLVEITVGTAGATELPVRE